MRAVRKVLRRLADIVMAVTVLTIVAGVVAFLDAGNMKNVTGAFDVVDGDSLRQGGRSLRLMGIDAPELNQNCQREGGDWPCGRKAKGHLNALFHGSDVTCTGYDEDRYGRLLVTCLAGSDNLNKRMVADGFAVSFGDYEADESRAQKAGIGIWAGSFERPSQWRAKQAPNRAEVVHFSGALTIIRRYLARTWQFVVALGSNDDDG